MPDHVVTDEKGHTHIFPNEATPEMIAQALGVQPPSAPSYQTGAMQTRKGGPIIQAPQQEQQQSPQVPSAMDSIIQGGKSFGGGVTDVPKSLPQFSEAGNKDSILGSWPEKQVGESQDYRGRAQQALKSGDLMSFLGHSLNAALAPTMIPQTVEGLSQTAQSDPLRAAGQLTGMGLMDKLSEPGEQRSPTELKQGVADASYRRGLGVQETLKSASDNIHDAVGQAAQSFVKKVDEAHPEGAIDPKPIMDAVNNAKSEAVKTPEKYPRGLAQMLEEEAAPESVSPYSELVQRRLAAGKTVDEIKAELSDTKTGRGLPPDVIQDAFKGANSGMWTAEQAKQWRTKIGSAAAASSGPMSTVLWGAYDDLTKAMRKVADDSDALKDYTDYNQLHQKHINFLKDPTVKKIMYGDTTADTLAPLSDPKNMAHVRNLLGDWDKYGIKTEDLEKEGTDYDKANSILERKRFKWFPGATLGGAASHITGLPWGVGAGAGLALDRMLSGAGKASKFIENSEVSPFYQSGARKATAIARGWDEGLPEISSKKIAIKKASGK